MGRFLARRLLASALLFIVAVGGGGMPVLDALGFHGPSRLAESLRSHYESSSGCHSDGCSIRSDAAPRILGDLPPQAPAVVAVRLLDPARSTETVPSSTFALPYLSRAPPQSA